MPTVWRTEAARPGGPGDAALAERPLRILMVVNAPWDRGLGGPRVQIEIGEQFRAMGHHVDSFSWTDAFPRPPRVRQLGVVTQSFARRLAAWLRRHGNQYDIVDVRAGSMAASKRQLGFNGLLVTRSTGLRPVYEREFVGQQRRTVPEARGRVLARPFRRVERAFADRRHQLGFEQCDLLNVLNSDEEAFARDELGMGHKTVKLLHGLTRERYAAFEAARLPVGERLARPQVAFIGSWCRRKGSADMREIVASVRLRRPDTRFLFLGTGARHEAVTAAVGTSRGIEVVPRFESDHLPGLLSGATVGLLPSYVEGFPFSVIELLAAGAPVVAYDAPGARETLPDVDRRLLVPRGDAQALGSRIAEIIELEPTGYGSLSGKAADAADAMRWEEIAQETLDIYRERLEGIRAVGQVT
jgi:glycosyltransferase involved in cell wall biosynthesis